MFTKGQFLKLEKKFILFTLLQNFRYIEYILKQICLELFGSNQYIICFHGVQVRIQVLLLDKCMILLFIEFLVLQFP